MSLWAQKIRFRHASYTKALIMPVTKINYKSFWNKTLPKSYRR